MTKEKLIEKYRELYGFGLVSNPEQLEFVLTSFTKELLELIPKDKKRGYQAPSYFVGYNEALAKVRDLLK